MGSTLDFKIDSNTLAPAPGNFLAPWQQRDGKFDLTQWDEAYFTRLKDFVAYAAKRGIVVEFVLFCPLYEDSMWTVSPMNALNNVNGIGDVPRTDVLALKDSRLTEVQDAMVRKIVSELRSFDNLYFEICNEPYFQGVTLEWQAHIAKVIRETSRQHLIAQNWSNGSKVIEQPNPLVGLFNFHYSRPPESVAMNWKLDRAIGNNETGFDGNADATYRIQGWDFLMAGGALYNNLDYSFAVGHEDGTFASPVTTPGGGSVALREQLGHLRAFFDEIPFWRMQPGPGYLELPGKIYAAYLHRGRVVKGRKPPFEVDNTPASQEVRLRLLPGKYTAKWRDTRTGKNVKTEEVTAMSPETVLMSPVHSEDIALLVRR